MEKHIGTGVFAGVAMFVGLYSEGFGLVEMNLDLVACLGIGFSTGFSATIIGLLSAYKERS